MTTRSPILAPEYAHYREVSANDTLPVTQREASINMGSYSQAHVQVVPSGGDNPTVQVLFWSDGASAFIPDHTPIEYAGKGVNTAYEFTVQCLGREMLVAVTGGGGTGKTDVYVAGYHVERV